MCLHIFREEHGLRTVPSGVRSSTGQRSVPRELIHSQGAFPGPGSHLNLLFLVLYTVVADEHRPW